MRSSTSSSKSAALFHAKMLVGICAVLIIAFELSSDYSLKHHSETYASVSQQYSDAVKGDGVLCTRPRTRCEGPSAPDAKVETYCMELMLHVCLGPNQAG